MRANCQSAVIFLIFSALVFSYVAVEGVRLVTVQIVIIAALVLTNFGGKLRAPLYSGLYFLLLGFLFCSYLITRDSSVLSAAIVFYILSSWPVFLNDRFFYRFSPSFFLNLCVFYGFVVALGVILQFILYQFMNIEFGRIVHFLNRTAFSFLWQDFSFLSLFLLSIVPISFGLSRKIGIIYFLVAFVAAVITTGRTGIFAFFVFVTVWCLYELSRSLRRYKISILPLFVTLFALVFPLIYYFLNAYIGVRGFSVGGSGRLEGYRAAFDAYISSSLMFGRLFGVDEFSRSIGTVPHNLFLYMLVFGGVAFSSVFIVWMIVVSSIFLKSRVSLFWSFFIVVVGSMLIPSFFSMYFFAILISVALFCKIRDRLISRRARYGSA